MNGIKVEVGDIVFYYHEHYIGKVEEYSAIVNAVHVGNFVDLTVFRFNEVNGVRYDPDGKPSSWRPRKGK